MSFKKPIQKILFVNPHGIGDVIFTTPLMVNIKSAYPMIEIGYICNRRTESIVRTNPHINKYFVYERDEFKAVKDRSRIEFFKKIMSFIKEVRVQHYDASIDVSLNPMMSFCTMLGGIKRRIGYSYKKRSKFLTHAIHLTQDAYHEKHMVEYYLDLLKFLEIDPKSKNIEIYPEDQDRAWANSFFQQHQINADRKVIAVVPGGGSSWGKEGVYRHWAVENFMDIVSRMISEYNVSVILMGDSADRGKCDKIRNAMPKHVYSSCGETSILQCAALMEKCDAGLLNDSGLVHLIVAMGKPAVSLYGPVNPYVYGPFPKDRQRIVRIKNIGELAYQRFRLDKESAKSSLDQLTPDQVYREVERMLKEDINVQKTGKVS